MTTWLRGARCTDPEAMPEMEARPPAENRHGGAPRGERPASWDAPHPAGCGSVAPHQRDNRTSAPVGAPPAPRWGWTRSQGQTRAQQRAAGTKNTALFDIVRKRRAASNGAPIVSRASAARPGTQGDTSGSRFVILALGPRKSGLPDLRAFTRRSRAGPRSVSRSARARALATLARDTRAAPTASLLRLVGETNPRRIRCSAATPCSSLMRPSATEGIRACDRSASPVRR